MRSKLFKARNWLHFGFHIPPPLPTNFLSENDILFIRVWNKKKICQLRTLHSSVSSWALNVIYKDNCFCLISFMPYIYLDEIGFTRLRKEIHDLLLCIGNNNLIYCPFCLSLEKCHHKVHTFKIQEYVFGILSWKSSYYSEDIYSCQNRLNV